MQRRVESPLLPALLMLIRDSASHGYELVDRMEGLGVAQRDPSAIYRSLYLLERWGLVSSVWDVEASGRPRRVYEITAEGGKALDSWMEDIRRQKGLIERLLEAYGAAEQRVD